MEKYEDALGEEVENILAERNENVIEANSYILAVFLF